ncbi:hypothetical protein [Leisingera sp. M523]|uniref:hypothetical protein n=1 Tax=Leisingera sp. M523 TaxID=2867013 RepID=UPI0021A4DC0E|nr:hypothetical protein [Leisingera sp. M523]UWQ29900.1 hypothetical protein K3557_04950 [Leisingera sp. M523]
MLDFGGPLNWERMRNQSAKSVLLHEGVLLADVAASAAGKLACLATPYEGFDGGPVLAADVAIAWMGMLARAGILPLSPAFMASEAGLAVERPEGAVRCADLVIVPVLPGWQHFAGVWLAAFLALEMNKPVYVLNGGV